MTGSGHSGTKQRIRAESPDSPMLHDARMSAFASCRQNRDKIKANFAKGCGTRLFNDFGDGVVCDKNDRFWCFYASGINPALRMSVDSQTPK